MSTVSPTVTALYRHPVKGFTPEPCDELVIQDDGRVQGDRVLAFRFADATRPEEKDGLDYWPKSRGLALMDFPSLARLQLRFDGSTLRITEGTSLLVEAGLDPAGRRQICDRLTDRILAGPDARRLQRPGRLPLELVGDGVTSRFQDRPRGFVSLHSEASVAVLAGRTPEAPVDSRRFRSNVVVDGVPAWEELDWAAAGTDLTVGEVRFTVQKPVVRCMAVTANPDTGVRDASLLKTLTREFGQDEPTLGVLLLPAEGSGGSDGGSGVIRVGDSVGTAVTA